MIQLTLTREEHYALTALLRSGMTECSLHVLGVNGLLVRLTQPYLDEIIARGADALAARAQLPVLMHFEGIPIHTQVPLASQSTGGLFCPCRPVDWYTWSKEQPA